jgi:uncharacterized protein with von Willebrand factor type A (vWA) domain
VGELNVFKQRWHVARHCTAVALVFDCSSSMNMSPGHYPDGERIPTRRQTAQALELAAGRTLARAQVPFSILRYDRRVYVSKMPQQRLAPAQLAANAHAVNLNGTTNTTLAIVKAAESLAHVDATRKMILVVTDGGCGYGPTAVSEACNHARARGIDQINCLSIDGDYGNQSGYDHVIEISADSLPTEGLKMLAAH